MALRPVARTLPALLAAAGLLSLAGWGLASSGGSSGPGTGEQVDLLLVTVDTLRPDALGWISGRGETPHLDALAREGFRFPAAVSPVPLTLPAHASLLTGLDPIRHGVRDNGQTLPAGIVTLAERMKGAGRSTGAFVSGYPLEAIFGLDQGFDRYDDTLPEGRQGWLERRAAGTVDAALAWLATAPEPWFAWVHLYDPHDPYEPPRAFWRPGPRGAYDGEVTYADLHLGRLFAGVRERARSPVVTVFTADHGEALGEHGERTHGYFVYDSTVVVPLVVHAPGRIPAGESRHPARLTDVAPTVLNLLGLAAPGDADGESLAPTLGGRRQPPRPAFVETRLPWTHFGWAPIAAVRHDGWKLVRAPRPELYDLAADPGERDNRVDRDRPRARDLEAELRRLADRPPAAAPVAADPEAVAKLRALGYVGAGGGAGEPPAGLPDPKDRLAERDALLAAEEAMRAGRTAEAVAGFDRVLAREPDNRYATLRSGTALLMAGDLPRAIERLERAVELDPQRAEARFALGDALARRGEAARAAEQWMELVRLQPRRFEGWFNLGVALAASGRRPEAAKAFREAEGLAPDEAARGRVRAALREVGGVRGGREDEPGREKESGAGGAAGAAAGPGLGGRPVSPAEVAALASCEAVRAAYDRRLEEGAACREDADCRALAGACADGLGGCWVFAGPGLTEAEVERFAGRWRELDCRGPVCRCAAPPPAACRQGRCVPAP